MARRQHPLHRPQRYRFLRRRHFQGPHNVAIRGRVEMDQKIKKIRGERDRGG
ncbi:hypothetical protein FIBSPDRAFT_868391 [Athelia psychrophila]|uniref:Uncharacterized protein n=1 Tax=Athelia psychrophila TaxID=1759441 RepID=A0A166D454_9AGAM|nr:hypothetical protein FIBSPDRAFT_868391 [Fibularhizoctonia sp. CBS 109695]